MSKPKRYDVGMAAANALMTVAEFVRLPRPSGGVRQELHHGELVELAPVKKLHTRIQKRLVSLLEQRLDVRRFGVDKEFPFRPAAEYEVWSADVAVFSVALWEQTPDDDYFRGVPEVVIEVLSPSNSAAEMIAREEICLRHGGREFWLVDPEMETVRVSRADGVSRNFGAADVIESEVAGSSIGVRDVFGE